MQSFRNDFEQRLRETAGRPLRWVVVFSPTGCDSMLEALGLLDKSTGDIKKREAGYNTYVATIGPTTRDYLVKKFGFHPEVCAEQPTPEGVRNGIAHFSKRLE